MCTTSGPASRDDAVNGQKGPLLTHSYARGPSEVSLPHTIDLLLPYSGVLFSFSEGTNYEAACQTIQLASIA